VKNSRKRLAVLASGGGSNLQAIHDHLHTHGAAAGAELVLVISDRAQAGALERARSWGVTAVHLAKERLADLGALLAAHRIDLIALAGFLRLVPPEVTRTFRGRILNVHPALLPAFGGPGMYGRRVHEAVLASGARVSGATIHFVTEQYDEGAIIAQWPVPVREGDTADALAARVLAVEHRVYPRCVSALADGSITLLADGTVHSAATLEFDRFAPDPGHHSLGG
jgi:formyltetrahydrofolate-dependent phosphoribosylglycinamide formyltransferase